MENSSQHHDLSALFPRKNHGTQWGEWSTSRPAGFITGQEARYPVRRVVNVTACPLYYRAGTAVPSEASGQNHGLPALLPGRNHGTQWGEWSMSQPARFITGQEPRYPVRRVVKLTACRLYYRAGTTVPSEASGQRHGLPALSPGRNHGTQWGEWSKSGPAGFITGQEPRYPVRRVVNVTACPLYYRAGTTVPSEASGQNHGLPALLPGRNHGTQWGEWSTSRQIGRAHVWTPVTTN
jgi:hypothetical protein